MPQAKHSLHKTRNDIPSNAKNISIQLLNKRLADGLDLALITKQAHWNLKGPQFISVHTMVDGFRTEQDDFNDQMAERITALGGTALGTTQEIAKTSSLSPYPTNIYSVADHIAALIDRYALYANVIRKAIDEAAEAGDAGTADLFTAISRGIDKQLWFLEAHTQAPAEPFRDGNTSSSKKK